MKTKNQFEALRREKKPRILVEENLTNANGNSRSKVMVPEGACQRHSLPENYHQHSNSTVDNSNSSRDNLQKSYKISHQSKDVFYLEILEKTELEIEGNLKLIIVKGEIKVSGKVFKEGEKLKIYASVNHVTLNANDACLISIEKFEFDFNVKPLKELDQNFKLNRIRDILETKLSTTSKTSVIIGPVNSGKSTTARYLTNMYLNNYETVAFLDCDLGQPEFTPPGMISLTLVKDPLLGHPCTHLKIPKHSIFIGDTSPKRDPDSYITGLYKLVDIYRKECNGIPLVVNTSGWIRGVGFDLLKHFVNYLNPETAIFMENAKSFNPQQLIDPIKFANTSVLRLPEPDNSQNTKLNSADHRAIIFSFYFYKLLTHKLLPLALQAPYKVAFGDVKIKFLEAQVPYSQALYALNGSVVALVIDSTFYHSSNHSTNLNFVPTHTHLNQQCVGLGLIKSISKTNNCFYILTPVESGILEKVNLLVKGGLEVTGLVGEKGVLPYTAIGSGEGIGSGEVKTRHLGRKKVLN